MAVDPSRYYNLTAWDEPEALRRSWPCHERLQRTVLHGSVTLSILSPDVRAEVPEDTERSKFRRDPHQADIDAGRT